MARVRLRHLHLPSSPTEGRYPDYKTAAAIQELLRRRLLDYKDLASSTGHASPPHPTLISFTPQPTYTLGRRQAQAASASSAATSSLLLPAEIARLKSPLRIRSLKADPFPGLGAVPTSDNSKSEGTPAHEHVFRPSVFTSPRGGLATYHGPGQVVLWPVMVINSSTPLGYKHFTVRCYSRLLENTTISLLHRLFGLKGFTTEDPGVWLQSPAGESCRQSVPAPSAPAHHDAVVSAQQQPEGGTTGSLSWNDGEVRKISAIGIHLRRHVSSLGAAINLDMPTTNAATTSSDNNVATTASSDSIIKSDGTMTTGPGEQSNPWSRFVACGLAGKGVTCVEQELLASGGAGIPGLDPDIVARAWAEELAKRMDLDPREIERIGRDEADELVWTAEKDGFLEAAGKDEL